MRVRGWVRLLLYLLVTGAATIATVTISIGLIECVADCDNEFAAFQYGVYAFYACVSVATLIETVLYLGRRRNRERK